MHTDFEFDFMRLGLTHGSIDERASWTLIVQSLEEKLRKKEKSNERPNKKDQPKKIDKSQKVINGFFRHKSGCQLGGRQVYI